MSASEIMELVKTIATAVAAAAATIGAAFGLINWLKGKRMEEPRAYLEQPEPQEDSLVDTRLVIENRGHADIRVDTINLHCGRFTGELTRDVCGGVIYGQFEHGTSTVLISPLLIVSNDRRIVDVCFQTNPGVTAVSARLVSRSTGFDVLLEASE